MKTVKAMFLFTFACSVVFLYLAADMTLAVHNNDINHAWYGIAAWVPYMLSVVGTGVAIISAYVLVIEEA